MLVKAQDLRTIATAANKMNWLSDQMKRIAQNGDFQFEVDRSVLDITAVNLLKEFGYQVIPSQKEQHCGFGACDSDDKDFRDIYIIKWN